jgi:hypothetical protein
MEHRELQIFQLVRILVRRWHLTKYLLPAAVVSGLKLQIGERRRRSSQGPVHRPLQGRRDVERFPKFYSGGLAPSREGCRPGSHLPLRAKPVPPLASTVSCHPCTTGLPVLAMRLFSGTTVYMVGGRQFDSQIQLLSLKGTEKMNEGQTNTPVAGCGSMICCYVCCYQPKCCQPGCCQFVCCQPQSDKPTAATSGKCC